MTWSILAGDRQSLTLKEASWTSSLVSLNHSFIQQKCTEPYCAGPGEVAGTRQPCPTPCEQTSVQGNNQPSKTYRIPSQNTTFLLSQADYNFTQFLKNIDVLIFACNILEMRGQIESPHHLSNLTFVVHFWVLGWRWKEVPVAGSLLSGNLEC